MPPLPTPRRRPRRSTPPRLRIRCTRSATPRRRGSRASRSSLGIRRPRRRTRAPPASGPRTSSPGVFFSRAMSVGYSPDAYTSAPAHVSHRSKVFPHQAAPDRRPREIRAMPKRGASGASRDRRAVPEQLQQSLTGWVGVRARDIILARRMVCARSCRGPDLRWCYEA